MQRDIVLEDILRELDSAQSDQIRLAVSGEALARFNEQLKKSMHKRDKAELLAKRILILTEIHAKILLHSENPEQAPLTLVGELCLILTCRVNPEKLPEIYLGSILESISFFSYLQQTVVVNTDDPDLIGHLDTIVVELICLLVATYDVYSKFTRLPMVKESAEDLRTIMNSFPTDYLLFDGEPITPRMAIDIFYDILARMKACGYIEDELFSD